MKRPTIKDATKQEFIEFFTKDLFGKQGRYGFERWLSDKRFKELDDKLKTILDLMDEEVQKAREASQAAVQETDAKKKRDLYIKSCQHHEKWDVLDRQYNRLQEEVDEFLEIGKHGV